MEIEITHNAFQMLVITPVVPQSHHFQTLRRHGDGRFSWETVIAENYTVFVATRQENMSGHFQKNKSKLPVHMCLFCCCQLGLTVLKASERSGYNNTVQYRVTFQKAPLTKGLAFKCWCSLKSSSMEINQAIFCKWLNKLSSLLFRWNEIFHLAFVLLCLTKQMNESCFKK